MNWDQYYFDICNVVKTNSKCLSRKIGSILVKDKSIISTGYNGPSRGLPHCNERYELNIDTELRALLIDKEIDPDECDKNICPRYALGFKSGEGLQYCLASHSERNCILNAAKHGICTNNSTLYLNTNVPCKDCLLEIINAGIKEVVCTDISFYDELSKFIVNNSELEIRTFEVK